MAGIDQDIEVEGRPRHPVENGGDAADYEVADIIALKGCEYPLEPVEHPYGPAALD